MGELKEHARVQTRLGQDVGLPQDSKTLLWSMCMFIHVHTWPPGFQGDRHKARAIGEEGPQSLR